MSNNNKHWFWGSVLNFKSIFFRIGLAATMINLLSVASSIFIMVVYDRVIPNAAFPSLYALTAGMAIVLVFDFILKNMRAWFIDLAAQQIDLKVGYDIYARILKAPLDQVSGSVGGLASVIKGFDHVNEFFTSATLALVVDLPFVFLFVFVIYLISGPLAIIPLLAIPFVIGVGFLVQPFISKHSEKAMEVGKDKNGLIIESLTGIEAIKSTGSSDLFLHRYQHSIKDGSEAGRMSKVLSQLATNSASSTQLLCLVCIVFYGTILIDEGIVSMGAMVAAVLLSSRAIAPLALIASLFGRLNSAKTAYRELDKLMNQMNEDESESSGLMIDKLGELNCSRVGFTYPNSSIPSLIEFNATIRQGEKIAIMGRNGSGKTTIIKLLSGLLMPTQGVITFDNLATSEIHPSIFQSKISVILQETNLFAGSIRNNILMGRDGIDESLIKEAMECSGVSSFISRIPGGMDAILTDRGKSLSAGQRQAISIARALVNDPDLLIMDEPTASLDLNAEQAFVKKLNGFLNEKTLIAVTHRIPLLELVDRIIVIADGKVALDGPRDHVLDQLGAKKS
tara:strand:- start:1545 stop:3242 length:1698 start_codon:yes stop_codon:yes gene_type:complete